MAFAQVPTISKSQINKAGQTLKKREVFNNPPDDDFKSAIEIAEQWRACHAYPINTFQATLRTKLRLYSGEPIVAQRLKRMPTIIEKLRRFPEMQLTTMQDIGGVRAVLETVEDVYKLANDYRSNKRLRHSLYNEKNYISNPRDEDGYRSLHLMYKYNNSSAQEYNDLRIELQIRTKLQHTWATAVETMGTFLGQALKSRQGDQDWLDFFATVSSAFACIEKTPILPRHKGNNKQGIFNAVTKAEKNLGALDKMRGFSIAADRIIQKRKREGWSYHLIILNSLEQTVELKSYNRDELEKAINEYGRIETEVVKGKRIEPVLVSAGPLSTLKRAYPNFFLDISDFCQKIHGIITNTIN